MPVSIDEFESGDVPQEPSIPERVVTYLLANSDHAFTRSEIAAALDADPNTVGTALSRLKQRELVRHRGEYWAISDDRNRVEAAYSLHGVSGRLDEEDGGIDADEWDEVAPDEGQPGIRSRDEDTA